MANGASSDPKRVRKYVDAAQRYGLEHAKGFQDWDTRRLAISELTRAFAAGAQFALKQVAQNQTAKLRGDK